MRVDAEKVGEVKALFVALIEELASANMNNNELKEISGKLHAATGALLKNVNALPPQGRVVSFSGTGKLSGRMVEQMAREATRRK
jgi:hypothetical protein